MAKPPALSPDEAKEKIRLILEQGIFECSRHCRRDSMKKRNVGDQDIFSALETGEIKRQPEWDTDHQNWKYRVEGIDTEGDDLTAVTVIFEADLELLVITVF